MARYPPLYQQADQYTAQLDRSLIGAVWPTGGLRGGVVTTVAATMNVSIAAGQVAVPMSSSQGSALCWWDAAEVVTLAAAPAAGNSRIDVIIAQVRDNALDSGGNNDFLFTAVTGTATTGTPAVPATPTNAYALANVTVPGNVTNLNTATVAMVSSGLSAASFPLHDTTSAATVVEYQTNVTGDTSPRITIGADGTITWYSGSGTSFNIGKIATDYANTGNLIISNGYGGVSVAASLDANAVKSNGLLYPSLSNYGNWVGSTLTGPPTSASENHQRGEIVSARNGVWWYCTTGGAPGTWAPAGGLALPAPVTTGTTVQSYTDPYGDVWVAKNGFRSGNWLRARDVVYSRFSLAATPSIGTAFTLIPFDTVGDDPLGLFSTTAHSCTVPVAGLYLVNGKFAATMTSTNQYMASSIYVNGAAIPTVVMTVIVSQQTNIHIPFNAIVRCNANDVVTVEGAGSVAMNITGGVPHNWGQLMYQGTG